ncbi:Gfo/Idh/MocA family oxidoreductase [Pseudomonas caspiana]|uniref:Gfo/Idh/MocA family protein n=1 Tax=Pseudomonas caspiana TaxID=1451454 RepID=UPI0032ECA1F5
MTYPEHVLVVGTGSIAKRHIVNLKQHLNIPRVSCVSASGRTILRDEVGADYAYSSIREAMSTRPNFVIVASPSPFHIEHALVALDLGIPTLVEKPLAPGLADVERHRNLLWANESLIQVAYNLRSMPAAQKMRRLLHSSMIGRLLNVQVDVGQYLPDWRPGTDYRTGVSAQSSLGGGVFLELSHEIDYLLWFFGAFETVYCLSSNSGQLEIDVEDRVDAIFSRKDGLIVYLHMDFLQRSLSRFCRVIGETGTLHWDLVKNRIILERVGGAVEVLFSEPVADRNQMYIDELKVFFDRRCAQQINASLWESAQVLVTIDAMKRSVERASSVSIERKSL